MRSLGRLFRLDDNPERVARSFGIGTFIGMSVFLGLHVVLGLAVAQIFRLNRKAMLAGVFVNNPWTLVPFYSLSTWIGLVLLKRPRSFPAVDWGSVTAATLVGELSSLLLPLALGSTGLALASGIAGYLLLRRLLRRNSIAATPVHCPASPAGAAHGKDTIDSHPPDRPPRP